MSTVYLPAWITMRILMEHWLYSDMMVLRVLLATISIKLTDVRSSMM